MNKIIFLLSLSLFFSIAMFAQTASTEDAVFDLFENPEDIQWLKHYKGRMNDLNDIAITLAFDGKACKGLLTYLRSKERFRLVGKLDDDNIHLQEVDKKAAVSGYVKATISDRKIIGNWSNHNHTIGNKIELEQTANEIKLPSYCGDNKWIRKYRGFLKNEAIELILQKDNNRSLKGIAFFQRDQESFLVKGEMEAQGFILKLKDTNEKLRGSIQGVFSDDQAISGTYESPVGGRTNLRLSMEQDMAVACVEYADYMASYDLTFPKTKYAVFNKWMDKETSTWMAKCQKHTEKLKKKHAKNAVPLRASLRAYAWCDVDMISDQLISGQLSFMNTWSRTQEGKSINFDFYKAKEITLKDIFKADFNQKKFIQNYINKAISKHKRYRDFEFRKWLAEEDFPYFTLREEGISFATDFNVLYGRQQIVIPYTQLKKYLKKDSPIKHLIQ